MYETDQLWATTSNQQLIQKMDKEKIFYDLIDNPRNIYENATLFKQKRRDPSSYNDILKEGLSYTEEDQILNCLSHPTDPHISKEKEWKSQNSKFLNYHKSLTPHTFFNSIAIDHYIGNKTGLNDIKDAVVFDVGGGTGHFLTSFFKFPRSLEYYLIDPNVRLLHDQFIRMYPQLLDLEMGHILALGEDLPFKNEVADLVVSSSSIDHMKDHKLFIKESYRCLKSGGKFLVSSHISGAKTKSKKSISLSGMFESIARMIHRLQNRVALNDHVLEFSSTKALETAMMDVGFLIQESEVFKNYFYVVAIKS